ncbi:hypothetical protein DRN43_02975 [Thermococci archaeon]|uniref:hypothetical protein n=1 Tax=Palaeococcus sp. (in: euryarchaeotes) TaxID=2820298 RepID=UPI000F16F104|nr:hypothetical protein [Palaeococcus sp. (in: euryarchaeotes)]MCD6559958.1 hypothetical protein [Palaeococcus sp. (in: euryarchaeotes)]RLF89843.1 MAG: hypothetical protein DRN43_02975 [Thermococci archaeon]
MKFKGKTFGNNVRIEFEILTLGELKIDDLRDFDVESINLELRSTSSGLKVIGIWEGEIEQVGEGMRKAVEEAYNLRDRIIRKMKSRIESLRATLKKLGFREEVMDYGNYIRFRKKLGDYELVVLTSTRNENVRLEIYGNDRKIITPEVEALFEDVDIEELEMYDFEEEKREERLVINIEIPKDDEKPEKKIVEAIKIIENLLMA